MGFENIEVIFVDDKSTDDTVSIINNLSKDYDNVSLFHTDENSGFAGKPRNIGLEKASADYVLFLDGDDELLANSCEVLYDKIASSNTDIVIGGQINSFDGILQHNPPLFNGKEKIYENDLPEHLLEISPAISAKLFKKDNLIDNDIKFPEGISGQDLVFFTESLLNSKKIITLNNVYIYYRKLSGTSVTFNITEKYLYGLLKAYLSVHELFEKFGISAETQKRVFIQHINFFTLQLKRAEAKKLNSEQINNILNSSLYMEFSNKEIFSNDGNFKKIFENIRNGDYNNQELVNEIYKDTDFNSKIISQLIIMKEDIAKIKNLENRRHQENIYLKNENRNIISENNKLKQELDEIKNSKLWKLKNKLS